MKLGEVPVAILAGGRATRLGSLAVSTPKALLTVAGKPFVEHQLRLLERRGLRQVVLCVGHLGQQIAEHVGDGARFGLDVVYSFDGEQPLGTGGALRAAASMLRPLCWVLYGDSYLDFDYNVVLEYFQARAEPALMTVHRNDGRWDRSNTLFANGRVVAYEKRAPSDQMAFIDYGAGLLRASALSRVPLNQPYDLADLYSELAAEGLLAGYEVSHRFYEIGSIAGLRQAERHLQAAGHTSRGH